jgi:hypothetical protein
MRKKFADDSRVRRGPRILPPTPSSAAQVECPKDGLLALQHKVGNKAMANFIAQSGISLKSDQSPSVQRQDGNQSAADAPTSYPGDVQEMPSPQSAEERAADLDRNYQGWLAEGNYSEAAEALNGFNLDDINARLGSLSPQQIAEMHLAAVSNPRLGRLSQVALATGVDAESERDGERVTSRPVNNDEQENAAKVFGSSLDLSDVTITQWRLACADQVCDLLVYRVGEPDGGWPVVAGAVVAGFLEGVVAGAPAFDDAGVGAVRAAGGEVAFPGDLVLDLGEEGVSLVRGERPGRWPGG